MTEVRKGMPEVALSKDEFIRRYKARFYDQLFEPLKTELDAVIDQAWTCYHDYHKSPRQRAAGQGFQDPDYELPVEWLETRAQIHAAAKRQADPTSPARILLINGSPRSDQTCPGEMSKTWRLVQNAEAVFKTEGMEVEILDLSRLASEYGRVIYPCKSCVSTAMPLCHWPCSCYPNHAMGQVNDWMADIYPMWAAAHGIMIITPVQWYQVPSALKLMIDRLVCADGGNPDPTTTKMKHPDLAKDLELKGWDYPRHLAGRMFSVVVHGDAAGAEAVADHVAHWLTDMGLRKAGDHGAIARYVGYYKPYATSHDELDEDKAFMEETRRTARALSESVKLMRRDAFPHPDTGVEQVRPK